MSTLADQLDALTAEGELYERLPDGAVRCYACGHRCLIRPGKRGICKVRFNEDGVLRVPWGYVGALQCDPTEKKPFFHLLPGSEALTFGMLGCDFHCPYCLAPGTRLATPRGPVRVEELFEAAPPGPAAEIRVPPDAPEVYTHSGQRRRVRKLFRHPYRGRMIRIRPWYLPPLTCTPEHGILIAEQQPHGGWIRRFARAAELTADHRLAIPRRFPESRPLFLDSAEILRPFLRPYRTRRTIPLQTLEKVIAWSEDGLTSREIGRRIGKGASHIRHLRSRVARGEWDLTSLGVVESALAIDADGLVRFPKEHRPGIPQNIVLDTNLATLLGFFCAEGGVAHHRARVLSASLCFSFGRHESALVDHVASLLEQAFQVRSARVDTATTIRLEVRKASLAHFFEALCGSGARAKRVPAPLFDSPHEVVDAFLRAYAQGDGSTAANGLTHATTVSEQLAHGLAWLLLRTGRLPSLSMNRAGKPTVQGRPVDSAPFLYSVNWYFDRPLRKFALEDDDYWYVRLRSIEDFEYDGEVYNLEVDGEHSYLANLTATHNCQNWVTSQALRDPLSEASGAAARRVSPADLVGYALRTGAKVVASSYNEPLITSEWAVAIFKEARKAGLVCAYVSNGNATPEVLEYLRPHLSAYKVDLKTMQDAQYRRLGGVLPHVLDTIHRAHDLGLWVEVVTLVIPGFNDSTDELMDAARFLVSVSPDIPWHVTAFHQDYKMTEPDNTTAAHLIRAAEIGQEAGLRYVYAGNLPGRVGAYENTMCASCGAPLVERLGYVILDYHLTAAGTCPRCGTPAAGIWPSDPNAVARGSTGDLFFRHPRPVR